MKIAQRLVEMELPVADWLEMEEEITRGAMGERWFSSPLGIHAAVIRNRGVATIYSTDADFDAIEGIERVDPLKLEKMP